MSNHHPSSGRVFVSSTCGDLVDLRAVLEKALRDAGLTPVLSDRTTSQFASRGDVDAIETCLVNLRGCERCITVLSHRYGEPLAHETYGGLSATHLEYREALKAGIPVHVYIRDSLWAKFELHRNGQLADLDPRAEQARLLSFIEEHVPAQQPERSNWRWTFTDAVELAERVLVDLGSVSSQAMIRMLATRGLLPQLTIRHDPGNERFQQAVITNAGTVAVHRITLIDPLNERVTAPRDLCAGESFKFRFGFSITLWTEGVDHCPIIQVHYEIDSGERLVDYFAVLPSTTEELRIVLAGRQFLGQALGVTVPQIRMVGMRPMIPMAPLNQAYERSAL